MTLVFLAGGLHYVTLGLPGVVYGSTYDRYFFRHAVPEIEAAHRMLAEETGEQPWIVGTSKWAIPAALAFYGPEHWRGRLGARNFFGEDASMWEAWADPERAIGAPVLIVGRRAKDLKRPRVVERMEGLGPIEVRTLERDGVALRKLYYRTARRYLGPSGS